jgi:MYXO-CTERM domain-containing protein
MAAEPGGLILLSAAASSDPEGGTLTYLWEVAQRPTSSAAEINDPTLLEATLTPDVAGAYQVGLSVADPSGNVGRATLVLDAQVPGFNLVLAVQVEGKEVECRPTCPAGTVLIGSKVVGDATQSRHEESHGELRFSWVMERPSGSRATITRVEDNPAKVEVMPDVDGVYELRVTMKDDVDTAEAFFSFRIETPANYNLNCSSSRAPGGWPLGVGALWLGWRVSRRRR